MLINDLQKIYIAIQKHGRPTKPVLGESEITKTAPPCIGNRPKITYQTTVTVVIKKFLWRASEM